MGERSSKLRDPKRWAKSLGVIVLTMGFLGGSVGFAVAATGEGNEVPAEFSTPAPAIGDQGVYEAALFGDWDRRGLPSDEPFEMVRFEWRADEELRDSHGALRQMIRLHTDSLQFILPALETSFDTGEESHPWIRSEDLYWLDGADGHIMAIGGEGEVAQTSVAAATSQAPTVGFEQSADAWARAFAYLPDGLPALQTCLFQHPFQGEERPTNERVHGPACLFAPTMAFLFGDVAYEVQGLAKDALGRLGLHVAVSGDLGRMELWLSPHVAVPLQVVLWSSEAFGMENQGVRLTLTRYSDGAKPYPLVTDSLRAEAPPPPRLKPVEPWGLDDSGVDHPFPASRAFAEARDADDWSDLRAFLDDHPEAYVAYTNYALFIEDDEIVRTWTFELRGDSDGFRFDSSQRTRPGDLLSPLLPNAPALDTYESATSTLGPAWFDISPPPARAPTAHPNAADLMQRWALYGDARFEDMDAAYEMWVLCPDSACAVPLVTYWAGRGHLDSNLITPTLETPTDPGRITVELDGSTLLLDAQGRALVLTEIDMAVGSQPRALTPPGASSEATGDEIEQTPVGSAFWSFPGATPTAAIGITSVLLGLLYWLWPTLRATPVLGLFSRVSGPRLLRHPTRQRIMDVIQDEPGIHFKALQRETDIATGTLRHHLRKMAESQLIAERRQGGFTCFFPGGAVPRGMAEAAGVLKADSAQAVLGYVRKNPGASAREVANHTGLAPATVSYHLSRLRNAGLLESGRQQRALVLSITPTGRQALKQYA